MCKFPKEKFVGNLIVKRVLSKIVLAVRYFTKRKLIDILPFFSLGNYILPRIKYV